MSVIELEIDRILKESLSEGYPMYAKDWEYYGSKSRGAPAASTPSSEPEEEGEPRPERKEDCERIYREDARATPKPPHAQAPSMIWSKTPNVGTTNHKESPAKKRMKATKKK